MQLDSSLGFPVVYISPKEMSMKSDDVASVVSYTPNNRICPDCFKRYNVADKPPDTVEVLILPCDDCSTKKNFRPC